MICPVFGKNNNAGTKAPNDINSISKDLGADIYMIKKCQPRRNFILWFFDYVDASQSWRKIIKEASAGDVLVYQYCSLFGKNALNIVKKSVRLLQQKNVRTVVLIHDLDSLRDPERYSQNDELGLIGSFDRIISHNESMTEFFVKNGFSKYNIVDLGIFDYLYEPDTGGSSNKSHGEKKTICFAGNLSRVKSAFLYEIAELNFDLDFNVYGSDLDSSLVSSNINYLGSFPPNEIPLKLKGDYGLVWDGKSLDKCDGRYGEYLKYNNPNKTSLYIAAGIPVIVWDQAAIAKFVLENHLGIAVSSLENIHEILENISEDEYKDMKENAERIGRKLREGYYFKTALYKAVNY